MFQTYELTYRRPAAPPFIVTEWRPRRHGGLGGVLLEIHLRVNLRENLHELLAIDGLLLQQQLRHPVQHGNVRLRQVLGAAVRTVHQVLHLLVDDVASLGAVVGPLRHRRPQERGPPAARQGHLAQLIAEAHLRDHHARRARHLLEVVARAGGDVVGAEDELLGDASAERHAHLVLQIAAGVQARLEALLRRREEGEPAGSAAGDDGDLRDGVVLRHERADQGVTRLMVRHQLALLLRHHRALLLGPGDDALERVRYLVLGDLLEVAAGGHDRRLVHQVLQVGAGEPGGAAGDLLKVDVGGERLAAAVHLEDLHAALHVGTVDSHLAIETPGAEEGGVEHVGAVGGGEDDDAGVALETVHLGKKLVDGLLTLVVAAAHAGATLAADGVNLVDEDDAGRLRLRLLEEVAHAGGAHADEELHELGGCGSDRGKRISGLLEQGVNLWVVSWGVERWLRRWRNGSSSKGSSVPTFRGPFEDLSRTFLF
eukprot:1191825-Prorocentrum_minimum.AAC.2